MWRSNLYSGICYFDNEGTELSKVNKESREYVRPAMTDQGNSRPFCRLLAGCVVCNIVFSSFANGVGLAVRPRATPWRGWRFMPEDGGLSGWVEVREQEVGNFCTDGRSCGHKRAVSLWAEMWGFKFIPWVAALGCCIGQSHEAQNGPWLYWP